MTDLREAASGLLNAVESAIQSGDWKVDGACDPDSAIIALRQALAQEVTGDVDAVNMSKERIDEKAKREHEPWPSVQCVCGGTIYFKYTPPVSDYHEGWEEGFKAAKRKWVGLTDAQVEEIAEYHGIDGLYETSRIDFYRAIEITLKEKNT